MHNESTVLKSTKLKGLYIIENDKFEDERGYLAKLFDKKILLKNRINFDFTQVKYTYTRKKGSIRGIHMQKSPFEEDKIVLCVRGKIFEVAVDVRQDSKTYGKWFGMEFSADENKSFLIPKGFAHGYQTLTSDSEVLYLMTGEFSKPHNIGFLWNDPFFKIKWPLKPTIIAKKDRNWPLFN